MKLNPPPTFTLAAASRLELATTNKPFAEWSEVFPNVTRVATLVDRLVQRSEIVHIDGESYRLKGSQGQGNGAHEEARPASDVMLPPSNRPSSRRPGNAWNETFDRVHCVDKEPSCSFTVFDVIQTILDEQEGFVWAICDRCGLGSAGRRAVTRAPRPKGSGRPRTVSARSSAGITSSRRTSILDSSWPMPARGSAAIRIRRSSGRQPIFQMGAVV